MDLTLTPEQQDIVAAFERFFSREVPSARVRAAEPLGFDAALWRALADLGGLGIAVPVEQGGGGGGVLDAALVAEQSGRRLAPVPLVEASVAGRALAACGPAGRGHLDRLLAGDAVVTLAPRPARAGVAELVPAGAVADAVLVSAEGSLVLVEPAERPTPRADLGATALADVRIGGARSCVELATGSTARALTARARDEWRVLQAAALVGLAAEALAIAVAYATTRHQFGQPIGSFQAIAHRLADRATEVDGARLLAYEAAWACDAGEPTGPALASMAFAFCAATAARTTSDSLHVHGGYGFMQEYDPQLYYRRARSWALVHDSVRGELRHLASVLWPPAAGPEGDAGEV